MVKKLRRNSDKKRRQVLEITNPDAAGIDLGACVHYVAVPSGRDPDGEDVRNFQSHTPDLKVMAAWLLKCGIKTVAMESTGVYWVPVFEILEEAGLEVNLIHAAHLKGVPGRKSDVLDCQWIQELHSYGLLRACFRPGAEIVCLRTLVRHRNNLVSSASRQILLMQKPLDQMNVLVHRAVTDITGKTGMLIIRAIINGVRDPDVLASYRDPRCKKSEAEIACALSGHFRQDYLFTLKQAVETYDHLQAQIADCDKELETTLQTWEPIVDLNEKPLPPRNGRDRRQGNDPKFELRTYLYQSLGVDLTQVDGFQASSVLSIISETGIDVAAWLTVGHYTSWLGLCPGSRITGGKSKSGRTRKVVNRAANAYRMAASSLSRSKGPLGRYYRRMKRKLDEAEVITAVAHKLARIVYSMLKNKTEYDPTLHEFDQDLLQQKAIKRLKKDAKKLGFLIIDPETGECDSPTLNEGKRPSDFNLTAVGVS